jgi:hypothetical protein
VGLAVGQRQASATTSAVVNRLAGGVPRFVFAFAVLIGGVTVAWLAGPTPVKAEWPRFPVRSATNAARSADEIIVGTVIENVRDSPEDFRLRIDHVLRGDARPGEVRRFKSLYPGWPMARAANGALYPPCAPIPAWKGDVIEISLGALAPDDKTRYNGASWISGFIPQYRRDDLPRTTLEQMRALAAMPPTDTLGVTSVRPTGGKPPPSEALALIFASTFVAAMVRSPVSRRHTLSS